MLLSKLDNVVLNQASNEQQPIELGEDELRNIAKKLSVSELLLLGQAYMQLAESKVMEVRKPFDGGGNLRHIHYAHAIDALNVIKTCLQNFCVLLNTIDSLPSKIASAHLDITVRADQMIRAIEYFRQNMEKIKGRPLDIQKRS